MATNDKPLYKSITVRAANDDDTPVTSKKYRGISTVDNPPVRSWTRE